MRVYFRELTDKEWNTIQAASGAPPEMRKKIEVFAFAYLPTKSVKLSTPDEAKKLIETVARTAKDLLAAVTSVMRNRVARDSLEEYCEGGKETLQSIRAVLVHIAEAANHTLRKHEKGRREGDVALYWLVERLAEAWEEFSGKPFSRASRQRPNAREFVIKTCKIIDPSLDDATIDRVARIIVAERRSKKTK